MKGRKVRGVPRPLKSPGTQGRTSNQNPVAETSDHVARAQRDVDTQGTSPRNDGGNKASNQVLACHLSRRRGFTAPVSLLWDDFTFILKSGTFHEHAAADGPELRVATPFAK